MAEEHSIPDGRVCTKCIAFKPWDAFSKAARGRFGRNSRCRCCMAVYERANRERGNQLSLARYHRLQEPKRRAKQVAMAEALAAPSKRCSGCKLEKPKSEFGPDKGRPDGLRPYCKKCKARESRIYRERNPEVSARASNEWSKRNPDSIRLRNKRYREKPENRIHQSVSSRIYAALKGKRGAKTVDILGYSFSDLTEHLERQFLPGMSWDNYGEWHIDHIIPLSSFEIGGPDDPNLKRAWSLTNLRPLWRLDNIRKNAKILHLL